MRTHRPWEARRGPGGPRASRPHGSGRLSTLQLRSAQVGVTGLFHFRQERCNAFHRLVAEGSERGVMVTSRDRAVSRQSAPGNAAPRERSLEISFWGYSGRCHKGSWPRPFPRALGKQLPAGYSQLLLGPGLGRSPKVPVLALICSLKPYRSIQAWSGAEVAKQEIWRREAGSTRGPGWVAHRSLFAQAGLWATECKVFLSPLVFIFFFLLPTQDLNLMFCKASHYQLCLH